MAKFYHHISINMNMSFYWYVSHMQMHYIYGIEIKSCVWPVSGLVEDMIYIMTLYSQWSATEQLTVSCNYFDMKTLGTWFCFMQKNIYWKPDKTMSDSLSVHIGL
jgi:hypothetical protein